MPDITMCRDKDCPSREKCYRFTAIPTPCWQSYFSKSPRLSDAEKCSYFMGDYYVENYIKP